MSRRTLDCVGDQAARDAWVLMQRLLTEGEAHDRMGSACRAIGVPPGVIKTLIHLSPGGEPVAMRDLADHFSCDASYITSLVDGLEERGLAERRPHPTDRRVKTVVLTPQGAAAQATAFEIWRDPPSCFDALTPAEQRRLRDLLVKLADADPRLGGARFNDHEPVPPANPAKGTAKSA